jgi:hypothetical protein
VEWAILRLTARTAFGLTWTALLVVHGLSAPLPDAVSTIFPQFRFPRYAMFRRIPSEGFAYSLSDGAPLSSAVRAPAIGYRNGRAYLMALSHPELLAYLCRTTGVAVRSARFRIDDAKLVLIDRGYVCDGRWR